MWTQSPNFQDSLSYRIINAPGHIIGGIIVYMIGPGFTGYSILGGGGGAVKGGFRYVKPTL